MTIILLDRCRRVLVLVGAPALEAASPAAAAHGNKGHALAQALNMTRRSSSITKAIAIDSKDVRLLVDRGIVYRAATKIPEAMADFTKAIELEPKNELGYFERGRTAAGPESIRGRAGGPEQGNRIESE